MYRSSASVGDGSPGAALEREALTGIATSGHWHGIKTADYAKWLQRTLSGANGALTNFETNLLAAEYVRALQALKYASRVGQNTLPAQTLTRIQNFLNNLP